MGGFRLNEPDELVIVQPPAGDLLRTTTSASLPSTSFAAAHAAESHGGKAIPSPDEVGGGATAQQPPPQQDGRCRIDSLEAVVRGQDARWVEAVAAAKERLRAAFSGLDQQVEQLVDVLRGMQALWQRSSTLARNLTLRHHLIHLIPHQVKAKQALPAQ